MSVVSLIVDIAGTYTCLQYAVYKIAAGIVSWFQSTEISRICHPTRKSWLVQRQSCVKWTVRWCYGQSRLLLCRSIS